MPYELIAVVAATALAIRYVIIRDASAWSRALVVLAVAASLMIWWRYPAFTVVATLVQVAVSIFVLVYLRVNPHAV